MISVFREAVMNRHGLWFGILVFFPLAVFSFSFVESKKIAHKQASDRPMPLTESKLKIPLPKNHPVYKLSFSRDHRLLAATFLDEALIWDISNGQIVHKFTKNKRFTPKLTFLTKSDLLAARCGQEVEFYKPGLWDRASTVLNLNSRQEENIMPKGMIFSDDEKWLAVVMAKNSGVPVPNIPLANWVSVHEVSTGRKIAELARIPNDSMGAIALSPEGQFLATAADHPRDPKLKLWEVNSGRLLREFQLHKLPHLLFPLLIYRVVFSPNGEIIASANQDATLSLLDVKSGKELKVFNFSDAAESICFSSDGQLLVGLTIKDFFIINAKEQKIVCQYGGRFGPTPSLTLSYDGKLLALTISEIPQVSAHKDVVKPYIAIYEVETLIKPGT